GVGHLVRVFTFLDSAAAVVCSVHEFAAEAIDHRRLVALASSGDQPANGESLTALRTNIDRDLIGRTTNTAGADFDVRSDIFERLMEDRDRLLLQLAFNGIERTVNDVFGNRLLAVKHDRIHELGDNQIPELRVRVDLALFCTMAT